jgi:protein gp37
MADGTKIEWTDATWNVVNGCMVKSPGCTNCYAMKQAHRVECRRGLTERSKGGMVWTGEVRFNEKVLLDPLRWKRPRKIFVCAHGDLFYEKVPDEWIDQVFAVMALCPQHTFQVLTKRPERMRMYLADPAVVRRIYSVAHELRFCGAAPDPDRRPYAFQKFMAASARDVAWTVDGGCAADLFARIEPGRDYPSWVRWPLPNVWIGTSVEDQKRAEERIPALLATPAAVRWLSCEPLIGDLDLSKLRVDHEFLPATATRDDSWAAEPLMGRLAPVIETGATEWDLDGGGQGWSRIDWIVAGGESGLGARPMHPDWARSLRDQCAAAGVPFLFKQWGTWAPGESIGDPVTRTEETAELDEDGNWHISSISPRVADELHIDDEPDLWRVGKKRAGRKLDGIEHDGFPA